MEVQLRITFSFNMILLTISIFCLSFLLMIHIWFSMRARIAFWLSIREFHLRNTSKKITPSFFYFCLHFWNFSILDVCEIDLKNLLHILHKYAIIRVFSDPYFLNAWSGTRTRIPDRAFLLKLKDNPKKLLVILLLYFCIFIGCKKVSRIFRTNILLVAGCFNQISYLENLRRMKYSDILCSYLVHKRKHIKLKMEKRKLQVILEMLWNIYAVFLETAKFVDKTFERICSRWKMLVEEVIYLL